MTYDCIVIGASLAGLSAARALEKMKVSNFRVLEAKPKIGFPLKCGEAVETQTLVSLYGVGVLNEAFCENKTETHDIHTERGKRTLNFDYTELDRPAFESWLALPIQGAVSLGKPVRNILCEADGITLQTSDETIHTKSVILATGANFKLHSSLDLPTPPTPPGYAFGKLIESDQTQTQSFVWKPLSEVRGYAWIFPKKNGFANIGVAGYDPKNIRQALITFEKEQGLEGSKTLKQFGGHFPGNGPSKRTYAYRALSVGDAAGMVFSGTGEGITYALISGTLGGKVMAEAIHTKNFSKLFLSTYQDQWKKRFGRKLFLGTCFRRLLFYLMKKNKLSKVIMSVPSPVLKGLMGFEHLSFTKLAFFLFQLKHSRV